MFQRLPSCPRSTVLDIRHSRHIRRRPLSTACSSDNNPISVLWNDRVVFPTGLKAGTVVIDASGSSGRILECHPHESINEAFGFAKERGWSFVPLSESQPGGVLAPGLVDVHTHISALGRTWEGYESATKAAAAGGFTTLMGMPLNSLPPTTSLEAVDQERECAAQSTLFADVGLWGGVVPENCTPRALANLLDSPFVFGLKAFLSPLPPAAGFTAVSPSELKLAASICGPRNRPILVHSELMTQQDLEQTTIQAYEKDNGTTTATTVFNPLYEAHVQSRPPEWERRAVQVVCDLASLCHMHIVHLSDAGCLPIISERKQKSPGRLSVETCPHYLLLDSSVIAQECHNLPKMDTRFKCFPPIRSQANRHHLWSNGIATNLIDMLASDHSPCEPAMRCMDTGDMQQAWGGLSGLQYQLPACWSAVTKLHSSIEQNIDHLIENMVQWWSLQPSRLVPGLSAYKGALKPGFQADLLWWHPDIYDAPNNYSSEHHRWKDGTVYANRTMRGKVLGTWLRGNQVYNGISDTHMIPDNSTNANDSMGRLMRVD